MQTNLLSQIKYLAVILMALLFVACKEEPVAPEPDPTETPTETTTDLPDGLYLFGSNTIAEEAGQAASEIGLAVLDPSKSPGVESAEGIYGKFVYFGNDATVKLAYVEDGVLVNYGTADGGSVDSASTVAGRNSVQDLVINGDLIADAEAIEVTTEGLYYFYIDMNQEKFILMEVKANMIGDATELGWIAGTPLALKSVNATSTVFEATDVPLNGASGYRYRFNDGWHVFFDQAVFDTVATLSSLGVPSYQAAYDTEVNDLGFHLDNIPQKESGLYTITLTYNATTDTWSENKVKTGDLTPDYSTVEYGWFGNAFFIDETNTAEGAWSEIRRLTTPTQEGSLYTWSWTLDLLASRSFVIRENAAGGTWVTYEGADKLGSAFTDDLIIKEEGQDNYFVVVGGTYNVSFTIDAETEGRTLTIEPN